MYKIKDIIIALSVLCICIITRTVYCDPLEEDSLVDDTINDLDSNIADTDDVDKRSWAQASSWGKRWPNSGPSSWGKRWANAPSSWGKKWANAPSSWGKRDWQSFNSWGKRDADDKRKWTSGSSWGKRDDDDKRDNWNSFSSWGKRGWKSGSWGKRQNWKSFNSWGKRSGEDGSSLADRLFSLFDADGDHTLSHPEMMSFVNWASGRDVTGEQQQNLE